MSFSFQIKDNIGYPLSHFDVKNMHNLNLIKKLCGVKDGTMMAEYMYLVSELIANVSEFLSAYNHLQNLTNRSHLQSVAEPEVGENNFCWRYCMSLAPYSQASCLSYSLGMHYATLLKG